MFAPLAVAYIVSIVASLVVALLVTPVLCFYLLPRARAMRDERDAFVVAWLKRRYARPLEWTLRHPGAVIIAGVAALALALAAVPFMGREFLPPFNEGTLNINATLPPGTSLAESNRVGVAIERILRETPEVVSTTRRTGRAEQDEHAAGVNASELEVVLREGGRPHAAVLEEIRQHLGPACPGVDVEIGQPISHRIDHLLSGTRAQIAVKLFGPDLGVLRTKAGEIRDAMAAIPGIVDLLVEPQVGVPQVQVNLDRRAAAAVGLRADDLAESVELAFGGHVVSQVLQEQRSYGILVRLDDAARQSVETIRRTLIDTPSGARVPLGQVAEVRVDAGPNTINRENVQRRIIVQANVAGRDLGSVIARRPAGDRRARRAAPGVLRPVRRASSSRRSGRARQIAILSGAAIGGIFLLLYLALRSARLAALVMANLPLALIGGVVMVLLAGGTLSIASLIGFIALFGIATRNGIMLITHYRHLMEEEDVGFRGRHRPGLDGAAEPDSHDRAGHRHRPDSAGARGGRAGQGDPAADGGGHPRRHRHLHGAQHDRDPRAVPDRRNGRRGRS